MSFKKIVRVAAAQVASVFLDTDACVAKACSVIAEAARGGARLVVFPEGYVPAHPAWYHFDAATSSRARAMSVELLEAAVTVPGPHIDLLGAAAAAAGCAVVIGVCERAPRTRGTLHNTQVFIGSDGRLAGKHQKLTPTVGERLVHVGGYGDTLRGYELPLDPQGGVVCIGGLICAENSNGLESSALDADGVRLYASSWPPHFAPVGRAMRDVVLFASQSLAYRSGAGVVSACGVVSDAMIERVALTGRDREFLRKPANSGGSLIVDSMARIVAGPLGGNEELLFGDINLDDDRTAKSIIDYVGHYNRPDVLSLTVDRRVPALVRVEGDGPDAGEPLTGRAGAERQCEPRP